MRDVEVYSNYDLTRDSVLKTMPGRQYQNFTIVDPDSLFKPIVFDRSVSSSGTASTGLARIISRYSAW